MFHGSYILARRSVRGSREAINLHAALGDEEEGVGIILILAPRHSIAEQTVTTFVAASEFQLCAAENVNDFYGRAVTLHRDESFPVGEVHGQDRTGGYEIDRRGERRDGRDPRVYGCGGWCCPWAIGVVGAVTVATVVFVAIVDGSAALTTGSGSGGGGGGDTAAAINATTTA